MKKFVAICMVYFLVLLGGCSPKELNVKTAEDLSVEYGEELDNSKLFDAKESDENIKVKSVDGFEEKKVGEQTLKVVFTDGDLEAEKNIVVKVEDTKKPAIELKKETVTITAGDKLTLKDNVKSVNDPIDGNLKYSDKAIEEDGYYIDKGKLNTEKAGEYTVTVKAFDKNRNSTEKSFKVVVKKKATAKKESSISTSQNNASQSQGQTSAPATSGSTGNSSGSAGSSSNAGNSGSASNGGQSANTGGNEATVLCPGGWIPEKACNIPVSDPSVGSDGIYYNTMEEANAVALEKGRNGEIKGYWTYSVEFNDRTQKYIWVSYEDKGL